MYSYKVFLANGLVKKLEFWEETPRKRFCKIRVERTSAQKFYTSGDFIGDGQQNIRVTRSIKAAIEGYSEEVTSKCIKAFALTSPTLGDVLAIFPGAMVQFDRR